jgi:hypothetical protein
MECLVYLSSAFTAAACAWLLLRAWKRSRGARLLLWCGVCFALLALANVMLYTDKILLPQYDLSLVRESISLLAILTLIGGFILDTE